MNEYLIDTVDYKGYKIKLYQDINAENPRSDGDNLGTMVCFHNRYDFPNEINLDKEDYYSWEDVAKKIIKDFKPIAIMPVYLYDHSGLFIKCGSSFKGCLPQGHYEFDSGQIGFIFITKEDMKKAGFKAKEITEKKLLKF